MDPMIVIEQVGILAILMTVGYIGGKMKIIQDNESKAITTIISNVSLPALILSAFSIGYSKETLEGIIIVFVLGMLAHILGAMVGKLAFMKYPKEKKGVLRLGSSFSNSGIMGVPFIFALFGQKALLYGSIFMIPFNMLIWTYGESLVRKDKGKATIENIIKNPAVITILVGMIIFIFNVPLPKMISTPISMLSGLTLPLAMLMLGQKISKLKIKEIIMDKDIYYASFIRLIVIPLITLLILKPINIDPLIKNVIIILQALPVAILTVVVSEKHNANVELASKVAVVSHMFCIITVPIIALFL